MKSKSVVCQPTFLTLLILVFIFMLIWWVANQTNLEKTADQIVDELELIEQKTRQFLENAFSDAGRDLKQVEQELKKDSESVLDNLGRFIGDAVDKVKSVFVKTNKEKFIYPDGTSVEEYGLDQVEEAHKNGKVIMVVVDETSEKFHNSYHGYHPYPSLFQDLYLWYPYRAHQPHRQFFRSHRPCVAGKWVRFAGDWIYVAH